MLPSWPDHSAAKPTPSPQGRGALAPPHQFQHGDHWFRRPVRKSVSQEGPSMGLSPSSESSLATCPSPKPAPTPSRKQDGVDLSAQPSKRQAPYPRDSWCNSPPQRRTRPLLVELPAPCRGNSPPAQPSCGAVLFRLLTHLDVYRLYVLGRIKGPAPEGLAEEVYVLDQRNQTFMFTSLRRSTRVSGYQPDRYCHAWRIGSRSGRILELPRKGMPSNPLRYSSARGEHWLDSRLDHLR